MVASRKPGRDGMSLSYIISHFLVGAIGIYIGLALSALSCNPPVPTEETPSAGTKMTAEEWQKHFLKDIQKQRREFEREKKAAGGFKFPPTMKKFMVDYATVPRDDFNKALEIGVPMDQTKNDASEVLVLYTDPRVVPNQKDGKKQGLDPETALENCNTVKVILHEPAAKKKQCIAIVPQWESYIVHKFMRFKSGLEVGKPLPLKYVSRTADEKGRESKIPTWTKDIKPSYDILTDYLKHFPGTLEQLKPVLEEATKENRKTEGKVVIVMVCNKGQAHLFHNFVCSARARGHDLSRVMMFATDAYTAKLARDLGVNVYHDEDIFADMPDNAARRYGDKVFTKMMMAKVYCVHLVLQLGYDVLFQDVDVVWHKNPLSHLIHEESKEWDMIFQDDGSRQTRYRPYSPNTGFYFVRHNPLTIYFFNYLLKKGDLINSTHSHQAALAATVNEFVSWKGMRVKVWTKGENTLFPGGSEYHNSRPYMKKFIKGEIQPYIFHMSWTLNKDNKKLYLEQMAEWYVEDDKGCNGLDCCAAEPIVTCHFRDKPSKISCEDSPPIDKDGRSFWKHGKL